MAIPPPPQGPQPPPYGQAPYGPPGQPPAYGWQQPMPYAPQPPPSTNGLAITSMVLGILCLLPPLGLILGLVALSQIKKNGQRGKGMAIAGVTLSAIGTAFLVLALSLGWTARFWGGFQDAAEESRENGSTFSLAAGECFDSPTGKLEGETTDVDVVDCAQPHDGEAYGNFRLDDGSYPGESRIAELAEDRCGTFAEGYFGDLTAVPDNVYDYFFYPTSQSWSLGDRTVTCLVGDENGGKLTGSVRDATGGGADGGTTDGGATTGGSDGGATGGSGSGGAGSGGTTGGSGGGTGEGSTGELEGDPGRGAEV
ncbi:DUF4190 domain-containing protein [Streptomyces boluensis]|uniref:DUF4190 domain-containing protein n=1 Tax=Streptomyces boluensis TaxID=1775135 RepID=A0A964USY0_9ACTN|nr:DUF4190 domain-containing protein [Streptomyces boluensis]NBE53896.1 DUF4190 domain-containing protein [Streptomyces boluensis]